MLARHTDNASPSRLRRRWSVIAAAALFAIVTFVPAAGAAASVGSIPPDVTEFAQADNGLITELEEYFGVDQRGDGLDFSDGIELGEIDRIFLWSEAYHSGQTTDTPVQYVNRWKVPVLIGEEPVGIAMIGIDPATVEPEMIDFIRSPGTTLALDSIDEDATLVHEPETQAWFSLSDGVIVPLVRGDSGISGEITLAQYQRLLSGRVVTIVDPTPQPDQGSVQSVVLIVTTVVVLLLALLIPTIIGQVRERRERQAEGGAAAEGATETETENEGNAAVADVAAESTESDAHPTTDTDAAQDAPVVASSTAVRTKTATTKTATTKAAPAKKAPAKKAPAKKPATKAAPAKTASAKAAGAKPAAPTTAPKKPVAKKPAAQKPAAKKPPAKKPAPAKPAASEPPTATESSAD